MEYIGIYLENVLHDKSMAFVATSQSLVG